MKSLIEIFDTCANREGYTTVTVEKEKFKRYEVDYKFEEDEDKHVLYIYFEPSDGRTDWIVNFSYWRQAYDSMKVPYRAHGGFLESWKIVHDAIVKKVTEKGFDGDYKWQHVIISGYSHGGALAVLCHECVWFEREDLRDTKYGIIGLSFDGPRVYGGLYIKPELKERWRNFYVIRNHNDIVTHLPPLLFFFRHVGKVVKIGVGQNPGLIGAHYPERIREGLEDFIEHGEMTIKEQITSLLEGVEKVTGTVKDVIDRNSDLTDVAEKIIEQVKDKIEN